MRITTNKTYQQPLMTTPYAGNADGYNTLYTIDDTSGLESANTNIQAVNTENTANLQELELEKFQRDQTESGLISAGSSFALNKALSSAPIAEGATKATTGAQVGSVFSSGFGYGALAYGIGEYMGGKVDDEDPTTYTGQEKTADFISHAGQGAMVGSYFGPWGAAIGAIGYGLYGLWKGGKDADESTAEQTKAQEGMSAAIQYRNDQQRKLLTVSGSNTGQEEPVKAGPGY